MRLSVATSAEAVAIERDALAQVLLGMGQESTIQGLRSAGLANGAVGTDAGHDELAAWQDQGWGPAIEFYVAGRQIDFVDEGDPAARVRTIQQFQAAEPCPETPQACDGSSVRLVAGRPSMTLAEALDARRTRGSFSPGVLREAELANTLVVGMGRVAEQRPADRAASPQQLLRSFGSAFDVHVVIFDVAGLQPGHYFFEVERSLLELRGTGEMRDQVSRVLGGQPNLRHAKACVLLVADYGRARWRYRHERALRNLYVDAGRVMNRVILAATGSGLQTGITPLLRDSLGRELLNLGEDTSVLYTVALGGRPSSVTWDGAPQSP